MKSWIGSFCVMGLVAAAGASFVTMAHSEQAATSGEVKDRNPDDWLLNAPDDTARFKLLQGQARGFSASMNEVGRRFESFYDALGDKNYELAAYQWQKIKEVIEAGTTRRPKRKANADAILLQKLFEPVLADVKSADAGKAWGAFAQVRSACMACHEAEKVAFMNNQPLFRRTEKPKP
jgi:hypothetical protein